MNKELEDIKWIKETAKLVDIFIEQIITNEKFAEIKERNGITEEEYEEYKEYKYSKSIEKVFNYIDNSISKELIEAKIEELNKNIDKYREYTELGIETNIEWVDNVADRQTVRVLQELLEGK